LELQAALKALLPVIRQRSKILVVTDAGVDLDDELALIMIAALQRLGIVDLLAVTASMKPTIDRARLIRGTMTQLGYGTDLPDIPVGMGKSMIEQRNGEPCPNEDNCPYLAPVESLHMGDEKFVEILMEAEPQSITLILQSGFADACYLAIAHSQLMISRVRDVVIMGGVMVDEAGRVLLDKGLMVPNDANNNTFNSSVAQIFYTWCQQNGVPMVVTMRHAAYAAQVPFSLYDTMGRYPSPIGRCLQTRQYPSIRKLWFRSNSPVGSDDRGPLPPNRDRIWFVQVFCDGVDPQIGRDDDIVPHLGRFNLYDPLNVIAAIPDLRQRFFNPTAVMVSGIRHQLIGLSRQNHGVADSSGLVRLMTALAEYGIAAAVPQLHPAYSR
jgi:hypothetical protein